MFKPSLGKSYFVKSYRAPLVKAIATVATVTLVTKKRLLTALINIVSCQSSKFQHLLMLLCQAKLFKTF